MSNITPASSPATPAASQTPPAEPVSAAPKAPVANGGLPDSIKLDHKHDATEFFEAHKAANAAPGTPPSAAPAPVAPAPAAPPKAVEPAPKAPEPVEKGSLAAKLSAKAKPPVAAEPPKEPVSAANPEDGVVLDSKYSAPAHESFNQIKGIAKGLRDQLNAAAERERVLKEQVTRAASGSAPVDTAEVEKLRAEHKAMSERLAVVDLREHPEFHSRFVAPQQAALQEAQALLEANGVQGVNVTDLLSRPRAEFGKAVSEAGKGLSTFDQTDFSNQMRTAYGLKQQADAALGKSREVYSHLRTQTLEGQKAVFNKVWERAAGPVGEHLVELDLPDNATAPQREQIENYNTAIRGLRTHAEQVALGAATPEHVAENSIKAAAYDFHIRHAMPRILSEYEGLLALNRQMAEQLKGYLARNPNRQGSAPAPEGGGGMGPGGTLSEAQLSRMTHAEAAAALAPAR